MNQNEDYCISIYDVNHLKFSCKLIFRSFFFTNKISNIYIKKMNNIIYM